MSIDIDTFARLIKGSFGDNVEDITWLVEHDYAEYHSNVFGHNSYRILKPFDYNAHYNFNRKFIITKGPKQNVKPIIKDGNDRSI